jgi:hypothetical protein
MPFTAGSFLLHVEDGILPQCSSFYWPEAQWVRVFLWLRGKSQIPKPSRKADSASRLIAEINAVQDALKENFPNVRWVFFEPDEKN